MLVKCWLTINNADSWLSQNCFTMLSLLEIGVVHCVIWINMLVHIDQPTTFSPLSFEMDANNPEHTSSENRKIKIHKSSTCCVPRCMKSSYSFEKNEERVSFHSFPKGDTAKIWRIKIHWNADEHYVTKYMKICSRHFKGKEFLTSHKGRRVLKQKAIPSIFPWTKHPLNIKTKATSKANKNDKNEHKVGKIITKPTNKDTLKNDADVHTCEEYTRRCSKEIVKLKEEISKAKKLTKKQRDHCRLLLTNKNEDDVTDKIFCLEAIRNNDDDVNFYTGFPTFSCLMQCFKLLDAENNIIYMNKHDKGAEKCTRRSKIQSLVNEFFLTLVRLRLGLLELDLAHRFSISTSTVQRICVSWVNFMYLRLGSINIWPTKRAIQDTMSEVIREKFPDLEWIIDAFEMQCQRPSSLTLQSQSYSNYKSRNTVNNSLVEK